MIMQMPNCPKCGLLHDPRERCSYDDLREALDGYELTADEQRFVQWAAAGDNTHTIVGLIERLRRGEQRRADVPERLRRLIARSERRGLIAADVAVRLRNDVLGCCMDPGPGSPAALRRIVIDACPRIDRAEPIYAGPGVGVGSIVWHEAIALRAELGKLDAWAPAPACRHRGWCTGPDRWGCYPDALLRRPGAKRRTRGCTCGPCHDRHDVAEGALALQHEKSTLANTR